MKIVPYTENLEPAVGRLNRRLEAGGQGNYCFPESATPGSQELLKRRYFVAVDYDCEVRGGYIIRDQPFYRGETRVNLSFLKLPVSEGTIDRSYATVGPQILLDAAKKRPAIFALGMGGAKETLPRILKTMGWEVRDVPFFFKILNMRRVLMNLSPFQSTPIRRILARLAAYSGAASLAFRILQPRVDVPSDYEVVPESEFGPWADEIWETCRSEYGLHSERSETTLKEIFRPFSEKIQLLRITRNSKTIAWFSYLRTEMEGDQNFGNLTVATLVDGFSPLKTLGPAFRAAQAHIEMLAPDLVITNQLHPEWQKAAASARFRKAPSNFAVALSPKASEIIGSVNSFWSTAHINRGDGDGPIHL